MTMTLNYYLTHEHSLRRCSHILSLPILTQYVSFKRGTVPIIRHLPHQTKLARSQILNWSNLAGISAAVTSVLTADRSSSRSASVSPVILYSVPSARSSLSGNRSPPHVGDCVVGQSPSAVVRLLLRKLYPAPENERSGNLSGAVVQQMSVPPMPD